MGVGWSTPRPGCFTPGKETRCPLCRRLGGPQGLSGRVRKISPPTGIRSPVERQHTVGRMERRNKQVTVRTRRKKRFQRNYVGTIKRLGCLPVGTSIPTSSISHAKGLQFMPPYSFCSGERVGIISTTNPCFVFKMRPWKSGRK